MAKVNIVDRVKATIKRCCFHQFVYRNARYKMDNKPQNSRNNSGTGSHPRTFNPEKSGNPDYPVRKDVIQQDRGQPPCKASPKSAFYNAEYEPCAYTPACTVSQRENHEWYHHKTQRTTLKSYVQLKIAQAYGKCYKHSTLCQAYKLTHERCPLR